MTEQVEEPRIEEEPVNLAMSLFFEAMNNATGVDAVFGDPVQIGDQVVIPVAETSMGGGLGFGTGPGSQTEGQAFQVPSGGGGGGGANARPVAIITVTTEGVKVKPIIDANKLLLSSVGAMAAVWAGMTAFVRAWRQRS